VVEHDLAKVGVEGSNPFARSRIFLAKRPFNDKPPLGGFVVSRPFIYNPRPARFLIPDCENFHTRGGGAQWYKTIGCKVVQ
jgi:hypothetical protein